MKNKKLRVCFTDGSELTLINPSIDLDNVSFIVDVLKHKDKKGNAIVIMNPAHIIFMDFIK